MRFAVSVGRRVEEDASPRETLLLDELRHREIGTGRVRAQDARQVADSHVVRDDGEVVLAQPLASGGEVANGSRERLLGIEPRVDRPPLLPETLRLGCVTAFDRPGDLRRQPAALLQIHVHAEEVLPGLGQDLGQARGGRGIVSGNDIRSTAALEEHDRLDEIRVESAVLDGVLDQGPDTTRCARRWRRRRPGSSRTGHD